MKRALCFALFVAGCARDPLPPEGHVVLYVDTDAPVPPEPGALVPESQPRALFDRIRIELLRDDAPISSATRDIPIDEGMFRARRVSLGIVPGDGRSIVRIRLFRGDRVIGSEPPAPVTLETRVRMPVAPAEGKTEMHVVLRVDDVGRVVATDATPGAPASSQVGAWGRAHARPCNESPNDGEACVPGGAFFMGDPRNDGPIETALVINDERLVAVSPFFIDVHEVTVAEFRAKWPELKALKLDAPVQWSGIEPPERVPESEDHCTWTPSKGAFEDRALNCARWATARGYCKSLGKDLPTEAQLEYVSSGLGDETAFPWGDELPSCNDAIWGRVPALSSDSYDAPCKYLTAAARPMPPGSSLRDRIARRVLRNGSDVEVLDLAGNLSELARDAFVESSAPFWSPPRLLIDPVVEDEPGVPSRRLARGGNFMTSRRFLRATTREEVGTPSNTSVPWVGFRCVRAAG